MQPGAPPLAVHIAPSVLAADLADLAAEVARVEPHVTWLHLDVFDGVAVPNLSFGAAFVAALRPHSRLLFDVHLCVARPHLLLAPLLAAGAGQISFHPSALGPPGAATDAAVAAFVAAIRAGGIRAALSLAPDEPAEAAEAAVAAGAACVNVLCVRPGFGGQRFQAAALDKVRRLRARYPRLDICVDGGVADDSVGAAAAGGRQRVRRRDGGVRRSRAGRGCGAPQAPRGGRAEGRSAVNAAQTLHLGSDEEMLGAVLLARPRGPFLSASPAQHVVCPWPTATRSAPRCSSRRRVRASRSWWWRSCSRWHALRRARWRRSQQVAARWRG